MEGGQGAQDPSIGMLKVERRSLTEGRGYREETGSVLSAELRADHSRRSPPCFWFFQTGCPGSPSSSPHPYPPPLDRTPRASRPAWRQRTRRQHARHTLDKQTPFHQLILLPSKLRFN